VRAGARFALYGVWALVLLGTFGLYSSALDATHYDKSSSAATKRASELTATCATAGCAEPSAFSPPGLSAAYARQVSSSFPWLASVFASLFRVFMSAGALAVQHTKLVVLGAIVGAVAVAYAFLATTTQHPVP
jgi:hypothetical protein